jgi:2-methylcitrate dehydratase PrpD
MTATSDILDFAYGDHRLPAQIRDDSERLLSDALAIGAAASSATGAAGVLQTARAWGQGDEARLLGRSGRLPATSAAYVNCFQIHGLEWDAVHEGAVVHATTAVIAALGAVIDRRGGCDPQDALTAVAVGTDIASGLGLAADGPLKFFRPATTGVFGAALAVARIEGLSRDQFADVLGLAHSMAAGTMQAHHEGSIALALQMANAARSAVHAVDLVRHGLTGPHDALEGPLGHFALFEQGDIHRYSRDLGKIWRIGEISTKPFPSGRASHATLGTLSDKRETGRVIESVEARVPPLIHTLVGRPMTSTMTPAYARLCLPFLCALMIRDGRIDPRRFTSEVFTDPNVQNLADKVTITVDGNPDPNALSPQTIILHYTDGGVEVIAVPQTLGSPDAPLTLTQSATKRDLCEALALHVDRRLFDAPLSYFTEPQ